jgi:hypothetical protein
MYRPVCLVRLTTDPPKAHTTWCTVLDSRFNIDTVRFSVGYCLEDSVITVAAFHHPGPTRSEQMRALAINSLVSTALQSPYLRVRALLGGGSDEVAQLALETINDTPVSDTLALCAVVPQLLPWTFAPIETERCDCYLPWPTVCERPLFPHQRALVDFMVQVEERVRSEDEMGCTTCFSLGPRAYLCTSRSPPVLRESPCACRVSIRYRGGAIQTPHQAGKRDAIVTHVRDAPKSLPSRQNSRFPLSATLVVARQGAAGAWERAVARQWKDANVLLITNARAAQRLHVRSMQRVDVVIIEANVLFSDTYIYACCGALFEATGWWDRSILPAQQMCTASFVFDAACSALRASSGAESMVPGVEFFTWDRVVVEQTEVNGGPTELPRRVLGDKRWVLCGPDANVGRLAEIWLGDSGDSTAVREVLTCNVVFRWLPPALPDTRVQLCDATPSATEQQWSNRLPREEAIIRCTSGVSYGPRAQPVEDVCLAIADHARTTVAALREGASRYERPTEEAHGPEILRPLAADAGRMRAYADDIERRAQFALASARSLGECPCCMSRAASVMPFCGHAICAECYEEVRARASATPLCILCRESMDTALLWRITGDDDDPVGTRAKAVANVCTQHERCVVWCGSQRVVSALAEALCKRRLCVHRVSGSSVQRRAVAERFSREGGVLIGRLCAETVVDTGFVPVDAVVAYDTGADAVAWVGRCIGTTHSLGTDNTPLLYIVHDGTPLSPAWRQYHGPASTVVSAQDVLRRGP